MSRPDFDYVVIDLQQHVVEYYSRTKRNADGSPAEVLQADELVQFAKLPALLERLRPRGFPEQGISLVEWVAQYWHFFEKGMREDGAVRKVVQSSDHYGVVR